MVFDRAGLVLPLRFTFPDWPVLILGPSVNFLIVWIRDSSLVTLAADLLGDPLSVFVTPFSMCPII